MNIYPCYVLPKSSVVLTWGCSHNQRDSQIIEQKLLDMGYVLLDSEDYLDANLVVVNTCTVKTPTENKILHILDRLKLNQKDTIVTGCLSQSEPDFISKKYPDFQILGVNAIKYIENSISKLNNFVELPLIELKAKHLQTKSEMKQDWINKPNLPGNNWNNNIEIIQINEGCLNSCTFCATKFARGRLKSYDGNSILNQIKQTKSIEIWLTSQDTGCWGFDINDNLPSLINKISKLNNKFWARIGMGNPNNVIKILDPLISAFESDKIYKFLHLPVQSGNNRILKHMKRGYDVETYELIVEKFREIHPKITISTDVICGYPTETEEEFQDTIKTILKTAPDICNISRYWERRGTEATKYEQLPHNIRKSRSKKLGDITSKLKLDKNKSWKGWEGEVLLAEYGSKGGIQARNIFYKPIILDEIGKNLGTWEKVKIIDYTETYLIGEYLI